MLRSIWLERSVVLVAGLVTVWGIGSFGIWDPWELEPRGPTDLAYAILGEGELAARLPNTLAGLFAGGLAYAMLARVGGSRAGVIAVAVLASTPLFLLNARLAMGDAIGISAQAWVGVSALLAATREGSAQQRIVAYISLGAGIAASSAVSGVLLGPLPPILAIAALLAVDEDTRCVSPPARWLSLTVALILIVGVVRAVLRDAPEHSVWLGGGAVGGDPPTWSKALELVFHGFAPWSTCLPVASVYAIWPRPGRTPAAQRLAWFMILWLAFAFVSWTVFVSRYGSPPVLAAVPLAGTVALWLDEASETTAGGFVTAVIVALFTGLLVRDYALYPDSALRVLAVDGLSVPEVYHPTLGWAIGFGTIGITLALMLTSGTACRPDPRGQMRWLKAQWDAPWPGRLWVILAVSVLGACVTFGFMCFAFDLPIASVVIRGGQIAFFAPLVIGAGIFGLPWLSYLYGQLGERRVLPVLGAALLVGAFIAWSFQPTLSQHFSPKPLYESYTALRRGEADPLAAYRIASAAARFYTDAPVQEIEEIDVLVAFLEESGQRWAIIAADQLPMLDRAYRKESGEHLYVADARSENLLLVAAEPIADRPNQSFIAEAVQPPGFAPEYPIEASYDRRIALVGYDLKLPEGETVGAGQRFTITWYWRLTGEPPSGHQVFVHVDGNGLRLNGDHEPVNGRYPVDFWQVGDIIADHQELVVPANFRSSDYVIYVGWFSGGNRLRVASGPTDGVDRVRAGVLPVR
jgi:hypothetical protein